MLPLITGVVDEISTPNEIKKLPEKKKPNLNFKSFIRFIFKLIRFISRVFAGAVVFVVFANFAPELKEEIPSFYNLVYFLLDILEEMAHFICNYFSTIL